ncbi:MAG: hypothetical protein M3P96_13155 [Actinomycetota bacterium]|nr:hypothetical protein [Actinomycetota bacterium]
MAQAGHQQSEHVKTGAGREIHTGHPRGRRSSWVAVAVMLLAFTVGAIALIPHVYWLTVVCAVIFVLGFGYALASGIMNDTH